MLVHAYIGCGKNGAACSSDCGERLRTSWFPAYDAFEKGCDLVISPHIDIGLTFVFGMTSSFAGRRGIDVHTIFVATGCWSCRSLAARTLSGRHLRSVRSISVVKWSGK